MEQELNEFTRLILQTGEMQAVCKTMAALVRRIAQEANTAGMTLERACKEIDLGGMRVHLGQYAEQPHQYVEVDLELKTGLDDHPAYYFSDN
ncbi:MAG: hypothetical protein ACUVWX_14740 [Kiritimatiellia bacterium]